jgi:hypothetical protein
MISCGMSTPHLRRSWPMPERLIRGPLGRSIKKGGTASTEALTRLGGFGNVAVVSACQSAGASERSSLQPATWSLRPRR